MTNASQEFRKLDTGVDAGAESTFKPEGTSKPRPNCSPVIQVTWRATDSSRDVHDSTYHCQQTPLRRPPRPQHLVHYHSTSSSSSSSSSTGGGGSSGSDSVCGVYKPTWCSSPRWFLGSPRVQQLKASESNSRSDLMLQSDLKCMHLSHTHSCSDLLHSSHQLSSTAGSRSSCRVSGIASPAKKLGDQQRTFNPFELDLVDTMHMSSYSPSVLSKCGTPTKEEQRQDDFTWDIEHIAILYPKELDNYPNERNPTPTYDPEMEDKIQCAINNFFAHSVDMPSPWLDNGLKNKISSSPSSMAASEVGEANNTQKSALGAESVQVAGKQHDENYFIFTDTQTNQRSKTEQKCEDCDSVKEANLSTSSLRRKLFANIEDDLRTAEFSKESPNSVPSRKSAITVSTVNPASKTPEKSADQFASSPVIAIVVRNQRASLTPPMDVASPTVSPIKLFDVENEQQQGLIPFKPYTALHQPLPADDSFCTSDDHKLPSLKEQGTEVTGQHDLEEPLEADMEPHWSERSKRANVSKMSFMETTEETGLTLPSGSAGANQDTGYQTNPRILVSTSSLSSCQDLTSFSTSIQAPLQLCHKQAMEKTPPSASWKLATSALNPDNLPYAVREEVLSEQSKMSISADDLPVPDDPQIHNDDATMWSPLVASTPSRKQYVITDPI